MTEIQSSRHNENKPLTKILWDRLTKSLTLRTLCYHLLQTSKWFFCIGTDLHLTYINLLTFFVNHIEIREILLVTEWSQEIKIYRELFKEVIRITFRNSLHLKLILPFSSWNNYVYELETFHWLRYAALPSFLVFCRAT